MQCMMSGNLIFLKNMMHFDHPWSHDANYVVTAKPTFLMIPNGWPTAWIQALGTFHRHVRRARAPHARVWGTQRISFSPRPGSWSENLTGRRHAVQQAAVRCTSTWFVHRHHVSTRAWDSNGSVTIVLYTSNNINNDKNNNSKIFIIFIIFIINNNNIYVLNTGTKTAAFNIGGGVSDYHPWDQCRCC